MMVLVLEYKDGDVVAEEVRTVMKRKYTIDFNRAKYYSGEDHQAALSLLKSAYVIKEGIKIPIYNEGPTLKSSKNQS